MRDSVVQALGKINHHSLMDMLEEKERWPMSKIIYELQFYHPLIITFCPFFSFIERQIQPSNEGSLGFGQNNLLRCLLLLYSLTIKKYLVEHVL